MSKGNGLLLGGKSNRADLFSILDWACKQGFWWLAYYRRCCL